MTSGLGEFPNVVRSHKITGFFGKQEEFKNPIPGDSDNRGAHDRNGADEETMVFFSHLTRLSHELLDLIRPPFEEI